MAETAAAAASPAPDHLPGQAPDHVPNHVADHPLLTAVQPLLERIDATLVAVPDMVRSDVPLRWEGETVAGVRLAERLPAGESAGGGDLGTLLDDVAAELGGSLADLPRAEKQRAVRMLEERGAFNYRKSAETVAEALGVTRFTVYNYLNRARG